jgi:glucose uptake protein GlcU
LKEFGIAPDSFLLSQLDPVVVVVVGVLLEFHQYFSGKSSTHLVGILGGAIWCLGTALSYIAAGKAGAAISYALGQGAPMIAALWEYSCGRNLPAALSKMSGAVDD